LSLPFFSFLAIEQLIIVYTYLYKNVHGYIEWMTNRIIGYNMKIIYNNIW